MSKKRKGRQNPAEPTVPAAPEVQTAPAAVAVQPALVEPEPREGYKINIVQPDKANPGLEMTWCLTPELMQHLAAGRIHNPFMLIVVMKDGIDVGRQIVPLDQGGTRLEFYEPGTHFIHTLIVKTSSRFETTSKSASREILDALLNVERNKFIYNGKLSAGLVTQATASGYNHVADLVSTKFKERKVVIDSEFFAPDPPAWLAWWVNLWFEGKQKNECHLRRRMIPAFSIQPPAVALWILMRGIVGVIYAIILALIGWKHITLKPIIHPFNLNLSHINSRWDSLSLANHRGYWTTRWDVPIVRIILTPLTWVIVVAPLYLFTCVFPSFGIQLLMWTGIILGIMILCVAVVFITARVLGSKSFDKIREQRRRFREEKEVAKLELESLHIKQKYVHLVCGAGGPSDGHLSSLPKPLQTFHVRFLALTGRVCRPYAKRR